MIVSKGSRVEKTEYVHSCENGAQQSEFRAVLLELGDVFVKTEEQIINMKIELTWCCVFVLLLCCAHIFLPKVWVDVIEQDFLIYLGISTLENLTRCVPVKYMLNYIKTNARAIVTPWSCCHLFSVTLTECLWPCNLQRGICWLMLQETGKSKAGWLGAYVGRSSCHFMTW